MDGSTVFVDTLIYLDKLERIAKNTLSSTKLNLKKTHESFFYSLKWKHK